MRSFKDLPVERALIERILEAAATAPMGMPPHSTEVLVIDRREELDFLLKELAKDYESMVRAFSSPLGRIMIRLSAGREVYQVLKEYIVDRSKLLRKRYGIPKENRVLTSLILGHPKYRYPQSIRRDLAGVRYA